MKIILSVGLGVLFLGSDRLYSAPIPAAPSGASYVEGELLVKFRGGPRTAAAERVRSALKHSIQKDFPRVGWQRVQLRPGFSVVEALIEYRKHADVLAAEPNVVLPAVNEPSLAVAALGAMPASFSGTSMPNDPLFFQQWALERVGAPSAWMVSTGSSNVVVAVPDSGVNYAHVDLAPNMWRNPWEIAGNGVDDDGNGYVDDVVGVDTRDGDGSPMDEGFSSSGRVVYHGTGIASLLGAAGGDSQGMAGLNWHIQIMAVRDSADLRYESDILEGIEYLLAMKARGVNIRAANYSYGANTYRPPVKDGMDALGNAGIVVVAGAGNDGADNDVNPVYPASYDSPHLIAVTASAPDDTLASFSNWGRTNVDLAAPGVSLWMDSGPATTNCVNSHGTSYSTPLVAGAVALLASAWPEATAAQLKETILNSVDALPALQGKVLTGGRLNIGKAMELVLNRRAHQPPILLFPPRDQGFAPGGTVTLTASAGGTPPLSYQWHRGDSPIDGATNGFLNVSNAQQGLWVRITNAFGATSSVPVEVTAKPVVAWGAHALGQSEPPADAASVTAFAAGAWHGLALTARGRLVGWGGDSDGQLGRSWPMDFTALAAGAHHSLGLKPDGTVVAWGNDEDGQCSGPGTASDAVAIAAGWFSSLVLRRDGTVAAWGHDGLMRTNPVVVPAGLGNVIAVAGGNSHWLALKGDGTVVDWTLEGVSSRVINAVAIAAGFDHSLALKSDGTVVAWGPDYSGETQVPAGLSNVVAVAAGAWWSMALQADGRVVAWGDNTFGQTNVPAGLTNVVAIAAGESHGVAVLGTGEPRITEPPRDRVANVGGQTFFHVAALGARPLAYQWLSNGVPMAGATNATYALRVGSASAAAEYSIRVSNVFATVTSAVARLTVVSPRPTLVAWGSNLNQAGSEVGQARCPADLTNVAAVAAGAYFNMALTREGGVVGWGNNAFDETSVPGEAIQVAAMAAGGYHSLALTRESRIVAWGLDNFAQCSGPRAIRDPVSVAAGWRSSLVLQSDGTVAGWGVAATSTNALVVPAGLSNVVAISAGGDHWMALKGDGTVEDWGMEFATPPGLTDVMAIAAGGYHSLALKTDGTVVTWGRDYNWGELTVPTGLNSVVAIAAGGSWSMALKANGQIVAWGRNDYGQATVPTGTTNIAAIAAGYRHGLALIGQGPPQIQQMPLSRSGRAGRSTLFSVGASGALPLTYQWLRDGFSIAGATNAFWKQSLSNSGDAGGYAVVVRNAAGAVTSSVALLTIQSEPFIDTPPGDATVFPGGAVTLPVFSAGAAPLRYQWYQSGVAIPGATDAVLVLTNVLTRQEGLSVVVSNAYGRDTSAPVRISIVPIAAWGFNEYGECNVSADLTNVTAVAGGRLHTLALRSDGTVTAWGAGSNAVLASPHFQQSVVPAGLSNVTAIAAGVMHSLALTRGGTVQAWGGNNDGQTNVPSGLSNVAAIASGQYHCLALRSNGTVVGWGWNGSNQVTVPAGLSGVVAIAAGYSHSLALLSNRTVVAWGRNLGAERVPAGLSNVVALVAGAEASLALKADGTVTAWGANDSGLLDVPPGLSNVVSIAGYGAFLALKSDGTVVAWGAAGAQNYGQTQIPAGLRNVSAIAGNGRHSLALVRMPLEGPVRLQSPALVGGVFRVKVPTAAGRRYFLESKDALPAGAWLSLPAVIGDGAVRELIDPGATNGQRFYRVRIE